MAPLVAQVLATSRISHWPPERTEAGHCVAKQFPSGKRRSETRTREVGRTDLLAANNVSSAYAHMDHGCYQHG